MQKIIIFSAILACAVALPAYFIEDNDIYPAAKSTITHSNQLVDHDSTLVALDAFVSHPIIPLVHEISSKKSTLTKSSQVVNHGGTAVLHAPVYHEYHPVMYSEVRPSKTTVTKSNQVVNHGGSTLVHAPVVPVVHAPVVHASVVHAPVLHAPVVHSPVYYSAPVTAVRSGDSATSHHSSTVHETVPVVNHLPLYALHN